MLTLGKIFKYCFIRDSNRFNNFGVTCIGIKNKSNPPTCSQASSQGTNCQIMADLEAILKVIVLGLAKPYKRFIRIIDIVIIGILLFQVDLKAIDPQAGGIALYYEHPP